MRHHPDMEAADYRRFLAEIEAAVSARQLAIDNAVRAGMARADAVDLFERAAFARQRQAEAARRAARAVHTSIEKDVSMKNKIRRITVAQFVAELKAQGVSSKKHVALVCPICSTVQSLASLVAAGAPEDKAENYIGFSCEGRFSNAGPWPTDTDVTKDALKRRRIRGCDWTLGGLFSLHSLEVITEDGKAHPRFEVATPAQAQALEKQMAERAAAKLEDAA